MCEFLVQFITDYGIVEYATLEIINVCILVLNAYIFYRYMNNQCLHSMCDSWYSISCANYLVGGSGSNTYSQSSSRDVRVVRGPQNINSLKLSIRLSKGNLSMVAFLLRLIIYIHWYFAVIYLIMICHFLQPTIFLRQFREQMFINPLVFLCNLFYWRSPDILTNHEPSGCFLLINYWWTYMTSMYLYTSHKIIRRGSSVWSFQYYSASKPLLIHQLSWILNIYITTYV